MLSVHQTAQRLLMCDSILFVTHKNPDGDTLGSAAALCSAMRRAGRKAYLYPNPQITERYEPYVQQYIAPADYNARYVVSVDVAAEDMLAKGFSGPVYLAIDHHPTNPGFAEHNIVCPEKAACGEIVLDIIEEIHGDLTAEEADLLYIAVSTDTGCFQYANTTADTFRTAARLVEYGARAAELNIIFFRKVSIARIRLEGMIYSQMALYRDGEIAVCKTTLDMLRSAGAGESDLDDIAALPGRVWGEKVGISIRELEGNRSKISVRTASGISASDICAVFGGGGHAMAAGCTIEADPDKAEKLILAAVEEAWK